MWWHDLFEILLQEAITGKCNVVCLSTDRRNPQPKNEDLDTADFFFYRTFDVKTCKISEEFPNSIAQIEGSDSNSVAWFLFSPTLLCIYGWMKQLVKCLNGFCILDCCVIHLVYLVRTASAYDTIFQNSVFSNFCVNYLKRICLILWEPHCYSCLRSCNTFEDIV